MELYLVLGTAISLGLIGSFHCAGMCGPIAIALPLKKDNVFSVATSGILYNLGRAITYSIMGFIFGLLGQGLYFGGLQQWISLIMGVIMVVSVIFPALFKNRFKIETLSFKYVGKLQIKLRKLFQKQGFISLFIVGLLNGLLPCGLVYMALAGAIATGNALSGALFMFVFGLGTLPMLLGISIMGNFVGTKIRLKINKLTPIVIVIVGILFILRGANLSIPFLSPPNKMLKPHKKMHMMQDSKIKNDTLENRKLF